MHTGTTYREGTADDSPGSLGRLSTTIDERLLDQLRQRAAHNERSVSAELRVILRDAFRDDARVAA